MVVIRGLGECAPRASSGYDAPVMDPSRASHSRRSASFRQPQSARPSTSFRQPEVTSQAAHDTLPGTQSSAPQQTTVPMSAAPFPGTSTLPVYEEQHHVPTPGATSDHDNAAVDPTPSWSVKFNRT